MADEKSKKPQDPNALIGLSPLYKVAVTDSVLMIRFVGNTAVILSLEPLGIPGIDPYQMLGAAEELKRRAFKMLQYAEVAEAKEAAKKEAERAKIEVTDEMPSGHFRE